MLHWKGTALQREVENALKAVGDVVMWVGNSNGNRVSESGGQ